MNQPTINFDDLPDSALLRWSAWAPLSPISRSETHARVQEGRFPAPLRLSPKCSCWRVADLRAWLADPAGWRAPGTTEVRSRYRRAATAE